MSLKLYLDFMSQPSRALYIFLKLNKVPFETCQVALRKGEHLTEEFKNNFNRFQKVPFIHDNNFKLSESIAVVRYIARKFDIDNHWYPKDIRAQAEVDEYLEWQHNNTRTFCARYFQQKWLFPLLTGKKPDPDQIKKFEESMGSCLETIEKVWLAKGPYITGDKITVADIFAACEIEQPRIAGFDPTTGHPILGAWLNKVRTECDPFYGEAHTLLNKLDKKGGSAKP